MPLVTINDTEIEVEKGTTLLQAAAMAGHDIPHFCYHQSLSIPANCRMCLVEIEGQRKLQPSCYTQVADGMVVYTQSERVIQAQKAVLEFILINHPVDCPICDQAGECKLQDYYVDYDAQDSRQRTEKTLKVKAYPIGPRVVYDGERCILCTRCVRFCREITQTNELTVIERGDRAEIRTFPGKTLDNPYSLCTVDLCPVGALTSRDFRFKCRVWLLSSTDSICHGCSRGCNTHLDHYRNDVQRIRPRFNPDVNDYWMTDDGRTKYHEFNEDRIKTPSINGANANWYTAADTTHTKLTKLTSSNPNSVAFVFSPQASCEDLYVAAAYAKDHLKTTSFYVAGKPYGEADDFLETADKNPNREGLKRILGSLDSLRPFEQLTKDIKAGTISGVVMMGSHTPVSDDERQEFVQALDSLYFFCLISPHATELADKANVVLPAAVHAEYQGTFVNLDGIAQTFYQAYPPKWSAAPYWKIFIKLAEVAKNPFSFSQPSQFETVMFAASPQTDPVDQPIETAASTPSA